MQFRSLGSSSLNVSTLAFGAWQIGDETGYGLLIEFNLRGFEALHLPVITQGPHLKQEHFFKGKSFASRFCVGCFFRRVDPDQRSL